MKNVPAKCHELGIEKIVFGPMVHAEMMRNSAYVLNAIAVHDGLMAALKSARLMLYAWRESRPAEHGPHPELDREIAIIEAVLDAARVIA